VGDQPLLHSLLLFHPSVLEPDLDLRLVELERAGDFDPARPRQVLVKVELLLQFGQLLGREVGPARVVDAARTAPTPAPGTLTARTNTVSTVTARVRLRNWLWYISFDLHPLVSRNCWTDCWRGRPRPRHWGRWFGVEVVLI